MITTFAAFDFSNLVTTQLRRILFPVLFVILIAIVSPLPNLAIVTAAIVLSLTVSTPFANDEHGDLDTLYASLPISRSSVVIGRYLNLFALYIGVAVLGTVSAVAATLARGVQPTIGSLAGYNAAAFLTVAVTVSIQLPFFFHSGFAKARPMMYIPIAVMVGIFWLVAQLNLVPDNILTGTPGTALVGAGVGSIVGGFALLIASAALSTRIYSRREL